jgi:hypothetical protein
MPNGSNGPNNRRRGLRNGHWQVNLEGRFLPLSDGIPPWLFLLNIVGVVVERFHVMRTNRDLKSGMGCSYGVYGYCSMLRSRCWDRGLLKLIDKMLLRQSARRAVECVMYTDP